MRDASKARGVEHTGVFERRATPLAPMQRWPNALAISRRALSTWVWLDARAVVGAGEGDSNSSVLFLGGSWPEALSWENVHPAILQPRGLARFPDPAQCDDEGLVAVGGDLSPVRLLSAYEN